jgi:uncharacterized membrane protein YdjX (TVP38/TMEM64 family)
MELTEEIKIDSEKISWSRPLVKGLLLLSFLCTGLLVVYFSPLRHYLRNIQEISASLQHAGIAAPLIYTLGVFLLVAFGFPRLILCTLGGMAFGFFWGLIWSQLGTLLGSYVQFLFIGWGGRNLALRQKPSLNILAQLFKTRGIPAIVLLRQLPMPGVVVNVVLVLMNVRHTDYLIGALIGFPPQAIPSTLIGAGFIQQSFGKSFGYITGAIILLMMIWLLSGVYVRYVKNKVIVSERPDPAYPGDENRTS